MSDARSLAQPMLVAGKQINAPPHLRNTQEPT